MDRLIVKATSHSAYLAVCSRAVAWLSPSAAVASGRTAADDCRVGAGKASGTRQPDAQADGKPIGAAESLSLRAVLKQPRIHSGHVRFDRSGRISMIAEAHAKAALSRRCILTGFAIGLAVIPVLPALAGGGSAVKAFLADIYQR